MMSPSISNPEPASVERTIEPAVRCYLELIRTSASALGDICPHVGAPYKDRLNRLQRRIAYEASGGALDQNHKEVEREIAECALRSGEYIDQIWNDVLSVLSLVTRSTDSMASRNTFYAARLRQFAQGMGSRSLAGSREEIEESLALDAAGIQSCVDTMARETEMLLSQFRHEIQSVAIKLADARASTILDPVTGLINRREMERKLLAESVFANAAAEDTSILRFDIADFPGHARRLGADASTNLERLFAAQLQAQIRPGDVAARWNPGRFVVIMQCALIDAGPRTAQITRIIEGEYAVEGLPAPLHIAVLQDVVPEAQAASLDTLFAYLDSPFPPV